MIHRRVFPSLVFAAAAAVAGPALAQTPPADAEPSASDVLLDPPITSSTEGIVFRPPAGGIIDRQLGNGEVVRFAYPDRGWTLVLKSAPNSAHLPLSAGPGGAAAGRQGLLEVAAAQLTDRGGKPATLVRQEVVPVGPRQVGLIEAHDAAGLDPVFLQMALIRSTGKFFILQMISPGQAPEAVARQVFQRTLATVELPDPSVFRAKQDRATLETRSLWLQLNPQRILSVLQPVHFMRVVRQGKDIGYVQVNERAEQAHGQDGVYVVCREHIETAAMAAPAPVPAAGPGPDVTPGLVVPQHGAVGAAAAQAAPTQLDRDARFFVTFDRAHEDWTTITRLDNRPGNDSIEMGNSDVEVHRVLNNLAARQQVVVGRQGNQPPVINREVDTLQVDDYHGKARSGPSFNAQLPPFYLPQAMGQLLPRLLPLDEPKGYLFAFYVPEQRQLLRRYVDVGSERAVTLDGQPVRAIPIADRIGADGVITTHYVNRSDGQWLGSVSDDGKLLVLPADESTLKSTWKGFTVLPEPTAPSDDERASRPSAAAPAQRSSPAVDTLPSILPPALDAGGAGGR